jgi:hypothetical protein
MAILQDSQILLNIKIYATQADLNVLLEFKHSHTLIFSKGKVHPSTDHEGPEG